MILNNFNNFSNFISNDIGYTLAIVATVTIVNYGLYCYFIKSNADISGFTDISTIDSGSTVVSHTNLTTQANSVIDSGSSTIKPILQFNSGDSNFYSDLVRELRARELYQNLPDGIKYL